MEDIIDRSIKLESIRNARDFGGLVNSEGKRIRKLCLLRSAKLGKASKDDLERLRDEYRLKKVVDLRTNREVLELEDKRISGIRIMHMPIFEQVMIGITHEKNQEYIRQFEGMAAHYVQMILDDNCRRSFRKILTEIMNNDFEKGSILWHCSEGKDRCGLVSAFIMSALGFDYDAVMDDYLLTNIVNEPRAEEVYESILKSGKSEKEAAYVRDMFLAKREYLDAALKTIEKDYDSLEDYLFKGLKLDRKTVERFRDTVLEDNT